MNNLQELKHNFVKYQNPKTAENANKHLAYILYAWI